MTPEQIAALPELLEQATDGPWTQSYRQGPDQNYRSQAYRDDDPDNAICTMHWHSVSTENGCRTDRDANARLIALAPTLAAHVLTQAAEIERLRARVSELHEAGWMHAEAFCIIEDDCQDEARRKFEEILTPEPLASTHAEAAAILSARDSIPEGE